MKTVIQPYDQSYLAGITELMSDLGYPTPIGEMARRMDQIQANNSLHPYVALDGMVVAGLIALRTFWSIECPNATAEVALIVTKKTYQGRGIGKQLMVFADEWAREQGAEFIMLTSGNKPERERAHGMYRHLGYRVNGYRFVKPLEDR